MDRGIWEAHNLEASLESQKHTLTLTHLLHIPSSRVYISSHNIANCTQVVIHAIKIYIHTPKHANIQAS